MGNSDGCFYTCRKEIIFKSNPINLSVNLEYGHPNVVELMYTIHRLNGLDLMRSKRLSHCDVKPQNILFQPLIKMIKNFLIFKKKNRI